MHKLCASYAYTHTNIHTTLKAHTDIPSYTNSHAQTPPTHTHLTNCWYLTSVNSEDHIRAKYRNQITSKSNQLLMLLVTFCLTSSGKNEVEWTGKANLGNRFACNGRSSQICILTYSTLKMKTFNTSDFSIEGTIILVHGIPHWRSHTKPKFPFVQLCRARAISFDL